MWYVHRIHPYLTVYHFISKENKKEEEEEEGAVKAAQHSIANRRRRFHISLQSFFKEYLYRILFVYTYLQVPTA